MAQHDSTTLLYILQNSTWPVTAINWNLLIKFWEALGRLIPLEHYWLPTSGPNIDNYVQLHHLCSSPKLLLMLHCTLHRETDRDKGRHTDWERWGGKRGGGGGGGWEKPINWDWPYQKISTYNPSETRSFSTCARNTPDNRTNNLTDSYIRNNNRCFNTQHCRTEKHKNSFFVRTLGWNHFNNTIVYADWNFSELSLWPVRAAKPLCIPPPPPPPPVAFMTDTWLLQHTRQRLRQREAAGVCSVTLAVEHV